jgi:uncharacterized protein YbjT (DUF2867 family)
MLLIIGATGTIGSELVGHLAEDGNKIRVFTRHAEKAGKFGAAVEVMLGDLDDPATLAPAMSGVDRFFPITSSTQQDKNALAAACKAGVRHVVKISTQEAGWTP